MTENHHSNNELRDDGLVVELLIVGIAIVGYALVSGRLESSVISAPMVFVTVGLAAGTISQLDHVDNELIRTAVEATLAFVLFTDAARTDLGALRTFRSYPTRLLAIGLPLTVLLGTAIAALVFDRLLIAEALVLAAAVAPTDAALGEAVVNDPKLPVRIRQALNVESGLNDGIIVPVVTVAIAITAEETGRGSFVVFAIEQIGFGVLVGAVGGFVGAKLFVAAIRRGWVLEAYQKVGLIGLIVAVYSFAVWIGGSGFIACYVAGVAFGYVARGRGRDIEFAAAEGQLLSAITFVLFGAVMVTESWSNLNGPVLLFAVLALTVMRMVPVWLAFIGSGLLTETKLFMGWFGPRGLASILFALQVHDELPGLGLVVDAIVWTIVLSVYAHGLTANPWVGHLARRLQRVSTAAPEHESVPEIPTRSGLQASSARATD